MKYMLIMRASDEAMESLQDGDLDQVIETMGRFNDEMVSAGVLVAAEGLDDESLGVVVEWAKRAPRSPRPGTSAATSPGRSTSPCRTWSPWGKSTGCR